MIGTSAGTTSGQAPQGDAWRACVEEVHAADGRVFLQLWHQGAVDTGKAGPCFTALSPSGLEKAGKSFGRAASAAELSEIINAATSTSSRSAAA